MFHLSLVPQRARPRKTVEDFMALPEGTLAELIDGELIMSPSPRPHHQLVGIELKTRMVAFVHSRGLGKIFDAPCDVHLPSGDIVQPDILFISKSNQGIIQDWIRGVPDLVVEVLSPDRPDRDRIVKRNLYARNGIPEYWIVDPREKTVEVFSLRGDRYEPEGYFTDADTFESPILPGFSFRIADLFAA